MIGFMNKHTAADTEHAPCMHQPGVRGMMNFIFYYKFLIYRCVNLKPGYSISEL